MAAFFGQTTAADGRGNTLYTLPPNGTAIAYATFDTATANPPSIAARPAPDGIGIGNPCPAPGVSHNVVVGLAVALAGATLTLFLIAGLAVRRVVKPCVRRAADTGSTTTAPRNTAVLVAAPNPFEASYASLKADNSPSESPSAHNADAFY